MSSEYAGDIRDRSTRSFGGPQARALAVQLLGPLTMLGGGIWALAQPHRIVFLDPEGKGAYDYLVQPPLLVVAVGLLFALLIAPGLADDLERAEGGEADGPAR